MKTYAALDVRADSSDMLLALVDDFGPTAVEERDTAVRVYFPSPASRDAARRALAGRFDLAPVDVPDDDWARRSQEDLGPVTVGRISVFPNSRARDQSPVTDPPNPQPPIPNPLALVIAPSMGFGTGHHATTRLCLAALQAIPVAGCDVLDVGTGSGILAIAAIGLGAARALGIDHDEDAVRSARENLTLNRGADTVRATFELLDFIVSTAPDADIVTANLTGALLVRGAPRLLAACRAHGTLVLSGLLAHEREAVVRAFEPARVIWDSEEDGWIGLAVKKP